MKQLVTIGDQKITVRGVKFKELKECSAQGTERIAALFGLLDAPDLFGAIGVFATENMEIFAQLALRFTDLSREQIDDMELPELTQLVMQWLVINGIDVVKVKDFFTKAAAGLMGAKPDQAGAVFTEPIPQISSS